MSNIDWKQIFISILVGAIVAFMTAFLEGALDAMRGLENNTVGGVVATAVYALKHIR